MRSRIGPQIRADASFTRLPRRYPPRIECRVNPRDCLVYRVTVHHQRGVGFKIRQHSRIVNVGMFRRTSVPGYVYGSEFSGIHCSNLCAHLVDCQLTLYISSENSLCAVSRLKPFKPDRGNCAFDTGSSGGSLLVGDASWNREHNSYNMVLPQHPR